MTDDRRLRPPDEHEKTIDLLVKKGIFETKQAALTFAAALGYFRSKRRKLDSAGEGVRWQVFERSQDTAFIFALAITSEKTINVLEPETGNKDPVAQTFEEYAAGGLDAIGELVASSGGETLDALLLLLAEARRESAERPAGLEGLSPSTLDVLGI